MPIANWSRQGILEWDAWYKINCATILTGMPGNKINSFGIHAIYSLIFIFHHQFKYLTHAWRTIKRNKCIHLLFAGLSINDWSHFNGRFYIYRLLVQHEWHRWSFLCKLLVVNLHIALLLFQSLSLSSIAFICCWMKCINKKLFKLL